MSDNTPKPTTRPLYFVQYTTFNTVGEISTVVAIAGFYTLRDALEHIVSHKIQNWEIYEGHKLDV